MIFGQTLASGIRAANWLLHGTRDWFVAFNIETSTACNRRCSYCPESISPNPQQFMSDETFNLILDRLAEIHYMGVVQWFWYNEPLLDPKLGYRIREMKKRFPVTRNLVNTNADYLTEQRAFELLEAGVNLFVVTTHGRDPETLKKHLLSMVPKRHLDLVVLHKDHITVCNRGGSAPMPQNKQAPHVCECLDPIITFDGKLVLCFDDYYRKHIRGDLHTQSFKEIWLDPKFRQERADIKAGKYTLDICKKCYRPPIKLTEHYPL